MITIYVIDKILLRSYAITLIPNTFIGKKGENINFTTKSVGDPFLQTTSFIQKFTNSKTETISQKIQFPISKDYAYTESDMYLPESDLFINQCSYLKAQATIRIQ